LLAQLTDPFQLAFMQRALAEVLLLSIPAGLLGSWIVLRRLSIPDPRRRRLDVPWPGCGCRLGFSPWLGAFGVAGAFAGAQSALERRTKLRPRRDHRDPPGHRLAAGSVLVSDVFQSAAASTACSSAAVGIGNDDLATASSTWPASSVVLGGRGLLLVSFAPTPRPRSATAAAGTTRASPAARRGGGVELGGGRRLRGLRPAGGARRHRRAWMSRSVPAAAARRRRAGGVEASAGLAIAFQLDPRPAPPSPCSGRRSTRRGGGPRPLRRAGRRVAVVAAACLAAIVAAGCGTTADSGSTAGAACASWPPPRSCRTWCATSEARACV
jgi:hypothetical protein